MVIVGLETKGGTQLPSALPLSPQPLTCAVSQEGEDKWSPIHGGDAPRLCCLSPKASLSLQTYMSG